MDRPLFLRTFRSLLSSYFRHPDAKAIDLEGHVCDGATSAELRPRPTIGFEAVPIGRETNYGTDVGISRSPSYSEFPDPTRDLTTRRVLRVLMDVVAEPGGRTTIAADLDISMSALDRYVASGRARATTRQRAYELALTLASKKLNGNMVGVLPEDPGAVLYLFEQAAARARCCNVCGERLDGRAGKRYCGSTCRERAYRARLREKRRPRG